MLPNNPNPPNSCIQTHECICPFAHIPSQSPRICRSVFLYSNARDPLGLPNIFSILYVGVVFNSGVIYIITEPYDDGKEDKN